MTDKEKKNRNGYWTQYKKDHYARIAVEVTPETKAIWQAEAQKQNKSLATFIKDIVNDHISRGD